MFYVLVKFAGNPVPELFGTSHISHAARLATMDGVEWASPTIANGAALEYATPAGGAARPSVLGEAKINAYKPAGPPPA